MVLVVIPTFISQQNVTLTEEDLRSLAVEGECESILKEQCPTDFKDVKEQDVSYCLVVRGAGCWGEGPYWLVVRGRGTADSNSHAYFVADCVGGSTGWNQGIH